MLQKINQLLTSFDFVHIFHIQRLNNYHINVMEDQKLQWIKRSWLKMGKSQDILDTIVSIYHMDVSYVYQPINYIQFQMQDVAHKEMDKCISMKLWSVSPRCILNFVRRILDI